MTVAKVNKSEKIREYLKSAKPSERSPKAVADALKAKGLNVSPLFVSVVKSHMKNGRKTKKATKAIKTKTTKAIKPKARKKTAGSVTTNWRSLITASNFINSAGGLKQAKALLDVVSQIRS